MPLYRCYFLDRQDHIQAAENIEAERLDIAVDCALAMLRARPQHNSVEVWQGALRVYCSRAQAAQHQCHIYDGSPSETLPVMAAMIERKLREDIRCMYLNSPPMITGLKFYLTSAGINLDQEIEKGSLVLSSDREHLAGGGFDADFMLGMLEHAVDEAERDGYRGLWATGDMTWELGSAQQSIIDILDYEWRLE